MDTTGFLEPDMNTVPEETAPTLETLSADLHALTQGLCLTGESAVTNPVPPDVDEQILKGYCQF